MPIGKLGSKKIFRDPYVRGVRSNRPRIPSAVRPYRYKSKRTARLDQDYLAPVREAGEVLTGYVRGQQASDLEERFARALVEAGLDFVFQYEVYSAYNLPGEEQTIDFVIYSFGNPIPIETGSEFIHGHPSRREKDRARDQVLNEIIRYWGWQEIVRLEFDHPTDVDDAREIVRELFL